ADHQLELAVERDPIDVAGQIGDPEAWRLDPVTSRLDVEAVSIGSALDQASHQVPEPAAGVEDALRRERRQQQVRRLAFDVGASVVGVVRDWFPRSRRLLRVEECLESGESFSVGQIFTQAWFSGSQSKTLRSFSSPGSPR